MPRPSTGLARRAPLAALLASLVAGGALASCGGGSSSPTTTLARRTSIEVRRNLTYGSAAIDGGARKVDLRLDLYLPPGEAPPEGWPVVVVVHGGDFTDQSKAEAGIVRIARGLAGRGMAAAAIDYRLAPQRPVPSARVAALRDALPADRQPDAVAAAADDTLAALDWVRDQGTALDLDTGRVGLVGESAGAITADHVAYAAADHGIEVPQLRFVASLWGGILARSPTEVGPDPADQLSSGEPALFAVHGDADATVDVSLDDALVGRAQQVGVDVEYHRTRGGTHGFDGSRFFTEQLPDHRTPFDRLIEFAIKHLA